MQPDQTLGNPAQNKSFQGGKSFSSGSGSARTKSFLFGKSKAQQKSFQTKEFRGKTTFWSGEYKTNTAQGTAPFREGNKKSETKTAEVKEAQAADRGYVTRDYETRAAQFRGTAQGALDAEYKNREPLSIDQVRELLNKNK